MTNEEIRNLAILLLEDNTAELALTMMQEIACDDYFLVLLELPQIAHEYSFEGWKDRFTEGWLDKDGVIHKSTYSSRHNKLWYGYKDKLSHVGVGVSLPNFNLRIAKSYKRDERSIDIDAIYVSDDGGIERCNIFTLLMREGKIEASAERSYLDEKIKRIFCIKGYYGTT